MSGVATPLNLFATLPGATESETTTRSLPLALAAVLAESLTTVTAWPNPSSCPITAESELETGTAPTTSKVSALAGRAKPRARATSSFLVAGFIGNSSLLGSIVPPTSASYLRHVGTPDTGKFLGQSFRIDRLALGIQVNVVLIHVGRKHL